MKQATIIGLLFLLPACSSTSKKHGDAGVSRSSDAGGGKGATSGDGKTGSGSGSGGTGGSSASAGKSGSGGSGGSGSGGKNASGNSGSGGQASGGKGGRGGSSGSSAGSGGKGAGGNGGSGGQAAAGKGGSSGAPATGASVLERNNHPSRDGHFIQPTLTKVNAAKMSGDDNFQPTFDHEMRASPLYLEQGPNNKGVFFAVTTGNDVLELDETTGAEVWSTNIGSSPSSNGVSCGDIHPLGILSTPVIDAASRTIYVAGAIGTNSIARHEIHALSVDDGKERSGGWPVDVSKLSANGIDFSPPPHNQRGALSLVDGVVYVPYGGHNGDCDAYHGWVIAVDAGDPTKTGAWVTQGMRGEGIWASGGLASDGNGVFAITGNVFDSSSNHAATDSEEVVRLTGMANLDRSDTNIYFPSIWRQMDQDDADFGANNPMYIEVPGATPDKYVVALSKNGHMYLLDAANLGGMDGHVVDLVIATGNSVRTAPAAYTTASGVHVVFSTYENAEMCPSGGPQSGSQKPVIVSVLIPPGNPPVPHVTWCATLNGDITAPIATTTDGTNEAIVWYMNDGWLYGVDGEDGSAVFSGGSDKCINIHRWTSPIAVKGRIVAGGDGHLCSWSPH